MSTGIYLRITAHDTVVTGGSYGLYIKGSAARLNIEGCAVTDNNAMAIEVYSGGIIRVAGTIVAENYRGLYNFEGTILSRGDNTIEGNTTANTGTIGRYWPR